MICRFRTSVVVSAILPLIFASAAALKAEEKPKLPGSSADNEIVGEELARRAAMGSGRTPAPAHTSEEICFSLSILGFTLLAMLIESALGIWGPLQPEHVFRLLIITIVAGLAVFTVPAGFSSTQVAPIVGLLGTILGYLFGRQNSAPSNEPSSAQSDRTMTPGPSRPESNDT